ncbi:FtsX-like permease family protein [Streptomyces sp. NRRL F-5630]|uniref:FtsX-like permease family protein n=1 Tax=Streptomyces sp. NRRL F-5630 TaxID=1463864 RepID=UPI003EC09F0E
MTSPLTLGRTADAAPPPPPAPTATGRLATWARDLLLGVRFAVSGGREGWARTALTAVGIGLGVLLLFLASSVPTFLQQKDERLDARRPTTLSTGVAKESPRAFLVSDGSSEYQDVSIGGFLVAQQGEQASPPPGTDRFPKAGEMFVSPALHDRLHGSGDAVLKARFAPYKEVGTIGAAGLDQPNELYFYGNPGDLATKPHSDLRHAGGWGERLTVHDRMDPLLVALIVMICVVLLIPVVLFIGTAVRFGGERRDRRLAALRLVGSDAAGTRRIAAGEALAAAVLGIALGVVFLLVGRQFAPQVSIVGTSAFPGDLTPVPLLALLIVLAVPVCAVAVTLFSLRAVSIEPLGVFRETATRGRRVWWRLLITLIGLALLLSDERLRATAGEREAQSIDPYRLAGGASLTLIGLATLLPWLVEFVVRRLRGGSVPWQLAVRRLQLSGGTAARAVGGITVAVAGAIALQMMVSSVGDDFEKTTGQDPTRATLGVSSNVTDWKLAERYRAAAAKTPGVGRVTAEITGYAQSAGPRPEVDEDGEPSTVWITVGDCVTLREKAKLPSCADGDVFRARQTAHDEWDKQTNAETWQVARAGREIDVAPERKHAQLWRVPRDVKDVKGIRTPEGDEGSGLLITPGAIDAGILGKGGGSTNLRVKTDPDDPWAIDRARNAVMAVDPSVRMWTYASTRRDTAYASVRHGLAGGAILTTALIGASLLVSLLEQLRERKRLLAALAAFGTKRSSLAWSLLWQTAIPVVLGLCVATAGGLALGWTLVRLINKQVVDWFVFLPLVAAGAGTMLLVTLLTLPALHRTMRATGLRTE